MKIVVYTVYYNGDPARTFLTRKSAIKYLNLCNSVSCVDDVICYRKEWLYV